MPDSSQIQPPIRTIFALFSSVFRHRPVLSRDEAGQVQSMRQSL
jgi:hypothetical protein